MQAVQTRKNQWLVLAGLILLCLLTGMIGGMVSAGAIDGWYRTLAKPSWNPPDWVFGPVWTTLYVMMAVAAWLVWRTGTVWRPPWRCLACNSPSTFSGRSCSSARARREWR
jgi:tryptophan-rich sensory protein